jgi:hypothetical protein
MLSVEMRRQVYCAGLKATRHRLVTNHVGLIGFQSETDYVMAPSFDAFSPETVRQVARQIKAGQETGIVGEYVWGIRNG